SHKPRQMKSDVGFVRYPSKRYSEVTAGKRLSIHTATGRPTTVPKSLRQATRRRLVTVTARNDAAFAQTTRRGRTRGADDEGAVVHTRRQSPEGEIVAGLEFGSIAGRTASDRRERAAFLVQIFAPRVSEANPRRKKVERQP
ncbi:hypothetical protein, partial [Halopelagius fulvigenes]